ncbi:MAG: DNA methyltransferase, partial [Desulfobacterales bacterium]
EAEDRIKYPKNSNAKPRMKNYLFEGKGVIIDNIWTDIPPVNSQAKEDTNYPTQKPEALLERIILASSNPGDLVMDRVRFRQTCNLYHAKEDAQDRRIKSTWKGC